MATGKTRKKLNTKGSRSSGGAGSGPITVDFLTLLQLAFDHAVIEGQVYKYVDAGFLPASIDHILLTGSGTQTYNNIGQAYVTAIDKYVECKYDLASNTIICILEQEFLIIDDGVTFSLTPLKDDFVGVTYSIALTGAALPYEIRASSNIWDSAKTKVVGFAGLDVNMEPLLSYGSFIGTNKVQVHVMNVYALSESDFSKQHSITFKVITTL